MQYRFADRLTAADVKRHIPHSFDIPAGCTRITVRLHFTPARVDAIRNMLTLTLFDPNGFRGAGHRGGDEHIVELMADSATEGYWAGSLPAGSWTAQIDTHMIMAGPPCPYELTVDADVAVDTTKPPVDGAAPRPTPDFSYVANPNPGWYRGDLHSHTRHSDASWDADGLLAAARQANLDFIALTDHNTTTPLVHFAQLSTPELLTMGGMELTTFWGHAVCLGTEQWIDWRVDRMGTQMAQIAEQVYAQGNLFIIAHPRDVGDPACTGCRWLYTDLMPGPARLVEIWNGAWSQPGRSSRKNEDGLALFYRWLDAGHRLVATAGTDAHGPAHYEREPGFNVVYAEALSTQGIVDAVAAGHLYLSAGPNLRFTGTAGEESAMMGDVLAMAPAVDRIELKAQWMNCPQDAMLRLVVDSDVRHLEQVSNEGERAWSLSPGQGQWCLVELRAKDGQMLALTNPIFLSPSLG